VIRKIKTDSIDMIEPMWIKLNEMHKEFDILSGQLKRTSTWLQRKEQLLEKSKFKTNIELYFMGDERAGYCYSTISSKYIGEIDSLFIEEKFRNSGIGTIAVQSALSWFEENKVVDIRIWVHQAYVRAAGFYSKFGFSGGPVMAKIK